MDLYIVGAGNVGGFVAYHANEMGEYNVIGFIDDDKSKIDKTFYGYNVVGFLDTLLKVKKKSVVAIAIATPKVRKKIFEILVKNNNLSFPNFIHPNAWICKTINLGIGNIIYPGVVINYETKINNFCILNLNSTLGHNCDLEDYVTLSPSVNLGGFSHIKKSSFIGIGTSMIQGLSIGNESVIGAGTVIIRDIPDYAVAVGNPARIIKYKK